MKGIICLWSGAVIDIPEGWHLCDGTEGTPDLREKFIVGAGASYNPGDTGGSNSHSHLVEGVSELTDIDHVHAMYFYSGQPSAGSYQHVPEAGIKSAYNSHTHLVSGNSTSAGGSHQHAIDLPTDAQNNLPSYYALCFIMKL